MKKKSFIPQTKVRNPEPELKDENWIIWAGWADRITFEEIKGSTIVIERIEPNIPRNLVK